MFRDVLGSRESWVPLYCGTRAHGIHGRPPPIIGEGTGRTVATEFRRVTLHWSESDLDPEFVGDEEFGLSPGELLATATTWTKPYGELHQFIKDGPRVSVDELRGDIVGRMPYLDQEQINEELRDAIGGSRSSESKSRYAYVDIGIEDGRSALKCHVCGVESKVSRVDLARKIDRAEALGLSVFVSPGGIQLK
jgi:hypothetical protein